MLRLRKSRSRLRLAGGAIDEPDLLLQPVLTNVEGKQREIARVGLNTDDMGVGVAEREIDRLGADIAADLEQRRILSEQAALAQDDDQPVDGLALEMALSEDLAADIVGGREGHQVVAGVDRHRDDARTDILDQQAAAEAGVEEARSGGIARLAHPAAPVFGGQPGLGHQSFPSSGSAAFSLGMT